MKTFYNVLLIFVCLILSAVVSPIFIQDLGYGIGLIVSGTMFVVLSTLALLMFNYLEGYKSEVGEGHSYKVIMLRSENLTNLGKTMGTESTFDNYSLPFFSVKYAKAYAEKEYGKSIKWVTTLDEIRSPDLLWVMYHIEVKTRDPL